MAYTNIFKNADIILKGMKSVIPSSLIEKYYECFPEDFANFVDSVGVVGGTVDLFMVYHTIPYHLI